LFSLFPFSPFPLFWDGLVVAERGVEALVDEFLLEI